MRRGAGCLLASMLLVLGLGQCIPLGIALAAGAPPDLRPLAALLAILLLGLLARLTLAARRRWIAYHAPRPVDVLDPESIHGRTR